MRPAQARGIPELTPALTLFAMLRDYSLATLDSAKAAAYVSGVIYSEAAANAERQNEDPEAMDKIYMERNSFLTMPAGWKMAQLKAEQPTGTYAEFKKEIITMRNPLANPGEMVGRYVEPKDWNGM